MADEQPIPEAPAKPLFDLDLGANGGRLTPTTLTEISQWISKEQQFWHWVTASRSNISNHFNAQYLSQLNNAVGSVNAATQHQSSGGPHFKNAVDNIKNQLSSAFIALQIPHSSSSIGKRIADIKDRNVPEALSYLLASLKPVGIIQGLMGNQEFSWEGFIVGICERAGLTVSPEVYKAHVSSIEDLQAKTETFIGDKRLTIEELHRDYANTKEEIESAAATQRTQFEESQQAHQQKYDEAYAAHSDAMTALESTFREKMALRAPVDYWDKKKFHHESRTRAFGWAITVFMVLLAGVLGGLAEWIYTHLDDAGKPDVWKLAVSVLLGVLGIWGLRIIIRIFLSHSHLATDAAERVTMVQTYLALLEGETDALSKEDRSLILQSLFRPASDGIVKDEGLPHPVLEMLTRIGK